MFVEHEVQQQRSDGGKGRGNDAADGELVAGAAVGVDDRPGRLTLHHRA